MTILSVISVRPVVTVDDLGITVGDALFSDGRTEQFRVLSLDPLTVLLSSAKAMPRHLQAVEEWLARHDRAAA
jgi:hypothetical protein